MRRISVLVLSVVIGGLSLFGAHPQAHAASVGVVPQTAVTSSGLSAAFTVTFTSTNPGQGMVLFGSGPGCLGLVGSATQDTGAGTTSHSITVTGNDLGGSAGTMPIVPGNTYWFEVQTVSASGAETDTNNGACYSVTVPATGGRVYTETNNATGNSIVVLQSTPNGQLTQVASVASGGKGSGAFLDSQGSVTLSPDGRYLFAVNAGDNTVSSFAVTPGGLTLINTEPSNGTFPVSITATNNLVYVVNEGAVSPATGPGTFVDAAGNISGFTIDNTGALVPLPGSAEPTGTGPREISFNPSGNLLTVTNRTSNDIYTYTLDAKGLASAPTITPSADPSKFGPFGFAFRGNTMVVADSNTSPDFSYNQPAGASSYSVSPSGAVTPESAFVANTQQITCWVVVAHGHAYTTNAIGPTSVAANFPNLGPGSISSYRIGADGTLTLEQGVAGTLPGAGANNLLMGQGHLAVDEAASGDFLYVLDINLPPDAPNTGAVATFRFNGNGTLTYVGETNPLPGGPGFTGLAAG